MKRRSASPLILVAAAVSACASPGTPTDRPNVLVLFTDDQRYNTVAALGNDEIRTPAMDRLADMGTAFTRAFVMGGHHGAICAPSRASLMTGRSLFDLHETGDVIPERHTMMPTAFAEAGYVTFATGKWHNDRGAFVRAFQQGDNIFFGGMHQPRDGGLEAPWLHHFDPTGRYPDSLKWQGDRFSSELYADAAIAFLDRQRGSDRPFFAYVALTAPHDPRTPPSPYRDWYAADRIALPANYLPDHPFDNGELQVRDEQLLPHPRTEDAIRAELAAYYGMISEVDAEIGRILDALEANGQLDHTIIVFAGDNGLAVGSHGLLGKQNLYDHSVRVPLIFAGPGIPRGERRDALAYLFDVFPTLTELAGLPTPPTVAGGETLVPVMRRASAGGRDFAYFAYRDLQRAVRTADDWKLIAYHVHDERRTQLFDLNVDPFETRDLADDPAFAERLERMEALLATAGTRYHDRLDVSDPTWGKPPAEQPTEVRHLARGATVTLATPFSPSYPGQGPAGLTDGIRCVTDFRRDCWQAYEQDDLEAVIDLGAPRGVEQVQATFLRNIGSWIFLPVRVEVAASADGSTFTTVGTHVSAPADEEDPTEVVEVRIRFDPVEARYVRLRALNQGTCPAWHAGAGGKAWLFVDEVVVR
jgi:arylsulfatase A-like enzyme